MADPIRQALERLQQYAAAHPEHDTAELVAAALATLAAEPPEPAEPDTDAVLTLAAIIREVDGNNSLGAAALAEAILSHPKVASVFQPPAPAPEADGEREELAKWLDDLAHDYDDFYPPKSSLKLYRAAALLREARPQPVPVSERPWERPGWCDAEGECWWQGRDPAWWTKADPRMVGAGWLLPHWAIPQPPQGGEMKA